MPGTDPSGLARRLPQLFEPGQARQLVERGSRAARGQSEARLFSSILRAARDDALEIEALYAELPGVLAGDSAAAETFRDILEDAAGRSVGVFDGGWNFPSMVGTTPGSNNFLPDVPCDPGFFINPASILYLSLGVGRVAGADSVHYERYVDALFGLWNQTGWLDHLYRRARGGDEAQATDRLGRSLRLIGREIERTAPELFTGENGSEAPSPIHPHQAPSATEPGFGFAPGPGGGADIWPGSDDGPPIPWPPGGQEPGGGPGDEPGIPPGGDPGLPPGGLPGERPSQFPEDPCAFIREASSRAVRAGARALRPIGLPESTRADNITAIEPDWACEGETLTITGHGFGATQPLDVNVLIGSRVVEVVSWSNTVIVIRIPPGAAEGCIGFRDERIEGSRRSQIARRQGELNVIVEGLNNLGMEGPWPEVPYVPSSIPCTPFNHFQGTVPVIDTFEVNGSTEWVAEPGTTFILSWRVRNAEHVRIHRTSTAGPALDITEPPSDPAKPTSFNGSRSLGPFDGNKPVDAVYEITVTNRCNAATPLIKQVTVFLRRKPQVKILDMEISQAIQHFDLTNPTQNNNVRLVARKKTMVRVYVDSGLRDGFAYGDDPNTFPMTGTLRLWNSTGGPLVLTPTSPDPGKLFMARPATDIQRGNILHTLNFELPWQSVQGGLFMEVEVNPIPFPLTGSVTGLAQGVYAKHSTSVSVHVRRQLRFAVIFIRYQNTPVKQKAGDVLQQIRNMYPVAEDGVIITQYANYETTLNLQSKPEWEQLLSDVAEITEDLQHNYDVFLGLLPDLPENPPGVSQYAVNGIGNATIAWPPGGISIENLGKTAAHETGHALGLWHADCPPAGTADAPDPGTIDNSLQTRTEEEGVDVYNHQAVPRGRGTVMSYCDKPIRWISIDLWDRLFDKLA